MNWNGQREILDHLIAKRADPSNAGVVQAEYNARRRRRVEQALSTQPVYLPLTFDMQAAGQTAAYRETTQSLNYDVIITGIKADNAARDVVLRYTENERSLLRTGNELDLYLRSDEIFGQSVSTGGGQTGVFYLPTPILLESKNRLTVEMFKTDTTADVEQANIVFIGVRVFRKDFAAGVVDDLERDRIEKALAIREAPQPILLKVKFDFDSAVAGGRAREIYTPTVDEPLLVRGIRTTLRQSEIELGIQGQMPWTAKLTPIWAVACEDSLEHDNYLWFSRPLFLHSSTPIVISQVVNSIDDVQIDAETDNTITFYCETV